MRKVAQQTEPAELKYTDRSIERMLRYLDTKHAARISLEESITHRKDWIARREADNAREQAEMDKEEKRLAALPSEGERLTQETAMELLSQAAKLPWIQEIEATDGEYIVITTRPGVLKTRFFERIAYWRGYRQQEMLDEPVYLPLPQYRIMINSHYLGADSWSNNGEAISISLADGDEVGDFAGTHTGWHQETRAHWASHAEDEGDWSDLCLGGYGDVYTKAAQEGLIELLNTVAMFLQSAGWSGAYLPKISWAIQLGKKEYNAALLREVENQEALEPIREQYRKDLAEAPKKFGVSLNEILYGSWDDDRREATIADALGIEEETHRESLEDGEEVPF